MLLEPEGGLSRICAGSYRPVFPDRCEPRLESCSAESQITCQTSVLLPHYVLFVKATTAPLGHFNGLSSI